MSAGAGLRIAERVVRCTAFAWLAFAAGAPAASCDVAPGEVAAVHERHMRALNAALGEEPRPVARAQRVFERLLAANGLEGRGYALRAYAMRGFNASAIYPRGVALSLVAMNDDVSDEELAAVLAHELAHLELGHALDQACEQWRLARSPLGFLDAAREFEREAVDNPSFAAPFARLSRAHELQADAFALRLLQAAGFPPLGLSRMLAARVVANPLAGTHPELAERLAALAIAVAAAP